jgi:Mg-chelatase subunit ChlD
MQANYYDNSTNMGEGLQRAIETLTSVDARDNAAKVIVLMSDGHSSTGPDPVLIAEAAADLGITIYTVSVGYGADRRQLQAIADAANGVEFYAAGKPEEYSAQLQHIFATIGGLGSVSLIE